MLQDGIYFNTNNNNNNKQATILFAGKCVDMNIITANMNIIICGHYEYLLGVESC